jgi:outer membrane protein
MADRRLAPILLRFIAMSALCLPVWNASAEPELVDAPLWEAGVGLGAVVFPVYRGAATTSFYALPLPYFVYRGSFFRADHNGASLQVVDNERFQLHFSANAGPPVKSSDVAIRAGMPDLRPTIEFGPSLEIQLWRSRDSETVLSAQLPVRAAVTLESAPRSIGAVGSAFINIDRQNAFGLKGWSMGMRMGPMFQTHSYDQYFYGVDPEYARAGRPAFNAAGGYAGTQWLGSVTKRFAHTWIGAFVRYDTLDGAAFAGSPLVQSRHYLAAGIGFSWVIRTSSETVRIDPARD